MIIINPIILEDFRACLATGFSMTEICDYMGISKATYYRYRNKLRETECMPEIKPKAMTVSFKRYYNAVMSANFLDKSELAERLGISRATLFGYENKGYLARLVQLLWLKGYRIDQIQMLLSIKSKNKIIELTGNIRSMDEIKAQLEAVKILVAECSEVDTLLTSIWANLTTAINKIDEIKKLLEQ